MPLPLLLLLLLLLLRAVVVRADISLHSPRGSNNKLNEQRNTAANNERLFDSQTNDHAGYQVGDDCAPETCLSGSTYEKTRAGAGNGTMRYHANSLLRLEWTVQHGCGRHNPNTKCEVVIQLGCEDTLPGLRDGSSTQKIGGNDDREVDVSKLTDEYGQHETHAQWLQCKARERNHGLFTSNQLNKDKFDSKATARFTRQGNDGNRYGFECPEERDYFPYWHPTPWRDVAVLTDDGSRCDYYQRESQNVRNKGHCVIKGYDCDARVECKQQAYDRKPREPADPANPKRPVPNNREACEQWTLDHPEDEVRWVEEGAFNIDAPHCGRNMDSNTNHLGLADGSGEMAYYDWRVPDDARVVGKRCVLRIRYNISESDVPWDATASQNGQLISPNPAADFIRGGEGKTGTLRLNINTNQYARTFEDRTHVFEILPRLGGVPVYSEVLNFNVRGRRGNIVQVYPSVEYDFVWPKSKKIRQFDFLHFQWTGSDANSQGNAGNGRQGTDRSNLVQMGDDRSMSYPKNLAPDHGDYGQLDMTLSMFDDPRVVAMLAFQGQTDCDNTNTNNDNGEKNCAVLNRASAYFNMAPVQMKKLGTFNFYSTRNTDFSNRSQKTTIEIIQNWQLIGIFAAGSLAMSSAVALVYRRRAKIVGAIRGPEYEELLKQASLASTFYSESVDAGTKLAWKILAWGSGAVFLTLAGVAAYLVALTPEGEPLDIVTSTVVAAASVVFVFFAVAIAASTGTMCFRLDRSDTFWGRKLDKLRDYWFFEGHRVVWLLFFALTQITMFMYGYLSHLDKVDAPYFPYAKAGGALLNFNCAVIIVPVARNFCSWLRTTPVAAIFPLDEMLLFHKLFGSAIFFAMALHVTCHYLDFLWNKAHDNISMLDQALLNLPGLTGHLILLIMLLMMVTSIEKVRRGHFQFAVPQCCHAAFGGRKLIKIGGFSAFQKMHRLWPVAMALLVFHGPRFWIYAMWPLILQLIEHLSRKHRSKDPVTILEVNRLDCDVMSVKMKLASGLPFRYRAGQYLYMNCEEISRGWHPFTITSAPEDPYFSVHIRCRKGMDWCYKFRERLIPTNASQAAVAAAAAAAEADVENPLHSGIHQRKVVLEIDFPEIKVDGPYGTATEECFNFNRLLLCGAGIGVTPFASIMRSIMLKKKIALSQGKGSSRKHYRASSTNSAWTTAMTTSPRQRTYYYNKVTQETRWSDPRSEDFSGSGDFEVQFFWICRDRNEFDAFKGLLRDEIRCGGTELSKMFRFHFYISGEMEVTSQDIQTELEGYAQYSKVYTGRPNWNRIFGNWKKNLGGGDDVGVFFCGPAAIGSTLKNMCRKHSAGRHDVGTTFHYHQEHF